MLTNLTDEGHLTWTCPYCRKEQTVHASHEHVQYTSPTCVVLPPCPECFARNGSSTRTTLTVVFPPEALTPPNIIPGPNSTIADYVLLGSSNLTHVREHYEMHPDAETGEMVRTRVVDEVIHPAPCVTHQMNLVAHLQAHGKTYTPPDPVVEEQAEREAQKVLKTLVLEVLKEQGIVPS